MAQAAFLGRDPSVLKRALSSPAFWAWLGLAALPPELLSKAFGWEMVDPAYLALSLLWWPLDTLGRLAALYILLRERGNLGQTLRPPAAVLGPALAAEILLALRSAVLALAGMVPALAVFSLLTQQQLSSWSWRIFLGSLAVSGILPAAFYALKRMVAPLELLLRPLNAGEALDASEKRLRGSVKSFLALALPWIALSWTLDCVGLALPDWVAWVLALPSLAAGVVPITLALDL